jgi:hypothetical protein
MKKYRISFDKRTLFCYDVIAKDEEQAEEIATQRFKKGEVADAIISTEAEFYDIEEINN